MIPFRAETLRVLAVCIALIAIPAFTLVACSGRGGPNEPFECKSDIDHPKELACTGLYSRWSGKDVAQDVLPFTPGFAAWSDGMEKQRWIALPAGAKIDTTNPDEWVFPVGTRVWKEFRHGVTRIETRFAEKLASGEWMRTTYRWSADGESAATELTAGEKDVAGMGYEIPSRESCATCHRGRADGVLGFDAITLSAPGATGLTLAELSRRDLLTVPVAAPIVPGDEGAVAALGWLHASCGVPCHNASPRATAHFTGLNMRLDVATLAAGVEGTNAYRTAVGVPSNFQAPTGAHVRIAPGDPDASTLVFRAGYRDPTGQYQMPPLGTHSVDPRGLEALRTWIASLHTL